MRKSTAAVLATGVAFVLTAAAASAISVTGPFDASAGSDAASTCDPGTVTVDPMLSGTDFSGFTLTTTEDTSVATQPACDGALYWVRIDYTELPGGTMNSTYAGNLPADDFREGQDMTWENGWFRTSIMGSQYTPTLSVPSVRIDATKVLVTKGIPTNFDFPREPGCFASTGEVAFDAKAPTAAFGTLNNVELYSSTDGTCTGSREYLDTDITLVGASSDSVARALCQAAGGVLANSANNLGWTSTPATWWICAVGA